MTDPWGEAQPPADVGALAPLPSRLARLAAAAADGAVPFEGDVDELDLPDAAKLPEVQELIRRGWRPADDAPLYWLLPAAWPAAHRTWVVDRLPKVGIGNGPDAYAFHVVALGAYEIAGDLDDVAEAARAAGLPAPPTGRIWLLRSPWPRVPVSVVLEIVWSIVDGRAVEDQIAEVYRVTSDVLTWDEERALAACPRDTRVLLDAWAAAGRVGEAAAQFIELELGPTEVDTISRRAGLDETALLAWTRLLGTCADGDTVAFIVAWHDSGLPGDPPRGADRFVGRDLAGLTLWLEAGFDLYAADRLDSVGLDAAVVWRAAGFSAADTYELLLRDPLLTPSEARAFDNVGPAVGRRLGWVEYGFSAAEAADWHAAGLTPYQARLWRAFGTSPRNVRRGELFPPELLKGRRYFGFSSSGTEEITVAEWDDIPDPPGTRGRAARRR